MWFIDGLFTVNFYFLDSQYQWDFFLYFSKDEVKGRECFEKFVEMNACMKEYPDLYEDKNSVDPEDELEDTDENTNNEIQEKVTEENGKRWCSLWK